ncbi:MAG: glycosyltransferase family 39 protein [Aquificota bacterium]|nr:glycosyltransferase family 39 protein [Aquificota bacterium]
MLFGVSEFSGRIVSGLSAVGIALLTYLMGRDLLGREKALIGAVIYATLIHNWVEARAATPEMVLTFFMVLGLYLFLRERFLMGWIALGFAFLAKGPVGVLLPSAVYLLWKRNLRFINAKGILLFFLIGLSWYGAMLYKFGSSYFYKFFIYENVLRYTGHKIIHPYPFWYYLPIVLASMLFYLPKLLPLLKRWERRLNPLLLWFLFVLLFYSLAKNKLHHYVLFLYPPLALMLANYTGRRYVLGTLSLSFLVLISLFFYAGKVESERFVPKAVELIRREEPRNLSSSTGPRTPPSSSTRAGA